MMHGGKIWYFRFSDSLAVLWAPRLDCLQILQVQPTGQDAFIKPGNVHADLATWDARFKTYKRKDGDYIAAESIEPVEVQALTEDMKRVVGDAEVMLFDERQWTKLLSEVPARETKT